MEFTEEFFESIQRMYAQLDEQDKQVIREFLHNSKASKILRQSFGPRYDEVVRMVHPPKKAKRYSATIKGR